MKTVPLTRAKSKLSGLVERVRKLDEEVMKKIRSGLAALKARKTKLYTLNEILGRVKRRSAAF